MPMEKADRLMRFLLDTYASARNRTAAKTHDMQTYTHSKGDTSTHTSIFTQEWRGLVTVNRALTQNNNRTHQKEHNDTLGKQGGVRTPAHCHSDQNGVSLVRTLEAAGVQSVITFHAGGARNSRVPKCTPLSCDVECAVDRLPPRQGRIHLMRGGGGGHTHTHDMQHAHIHTSTGKCPPSGSRLKCRMARVRRWRGERGGLSQDRRPRAHSE